MPVREALFNQQGAVKRRQLQFIRTAHVLDFPSNSDLDRIIAAFHENPHVEFAARNAIAQLSPLFPNDLNSEQWNMHNPGQTGGTSDVDIDAPEA